MAGDVVLARDRAEQWSVTAADRHDLTATSRKRAAALKRARCVDVFGYRDVWFSNSGFCYRNGR